MTPKKSFIQRFLSVPEDHSFFLFGARNTGKSTWLQWQFSKENALWINLLNIDEEERFSRDPQLLEAEVLALSDSITHIIIDEIQKIPKLLNIVHHLIQSTDKYFVMTGSSARKLKRGGANLLAGRAFVYHLFPFSFLELKDDFDLDKALHWGMLPDSYKQKNRQLHQYFLQAYAHTYIKEEIWNEQFIKKLDPFRRFLEVAAQCNGKIINYSNIARDVGVDDKTVKEYFSILEDTLLGFFLEPFQHSFRKRLSQKPKFYFFDVGVTRALARLLSTTLVPSTSLYGETFEHFIILECLKLATYYFTEYRFSYLKTKDDLEVDLIVERPQKPTLFIEIKSSVQVNIEDLQPQARIIKDFPDGEFICFSKDPRRKYFKEVNMTVYPWQEGIKKFFTLDTQTD